MTELLNLQTEQTMSSREIAELTGKRHDHILRDIANLNESYQEISLPKVGEREYENTRGQFYREFLLTKMQTFDLMTGYDTALRIRVNRRWEELENKNAQIDFSNPDTILKLAQNWRDEQVKRIEAETIIEEQKPKVVFAESVMGSSNLILIRDFAKSLCTENFKIGQNRLYAWFRENGILNSKNEPYQNYVERGYFEVITRVIGSGEATITTNTTKITGAGQVYFAKRIRDTYKQE